MATVERDIGLHVDDDYSSLSSWEANDYDCTGSLVDTAIGNIGDDGSLAAEAVLFNSVVPLNVIIRPKANQGHTGGKGTGATIQPSTSSSSGYNFNIHAVGVAFTLEDIEIDADAAGYQFLIGYDHVTTFTLRRNLIYDYFCTRSTSAPRIIRAANRYGQTQVNIIRNLIFDCGYSQANNTVYGIEIGTTKGDDPHRVIGNTIANLDHSGASGSAVAYSFQSEADHEYRNNIGYDTTGTTAGTDFEFIATGLETCSHNLSEDATADDGVDSGTSSHVINATLTFANSAAGDFRLVAGDTDAIGAGFDTTTADAHIDIQQYDCDAAAVAFDIGAHQFVSAETSVNEMARIPAHSCLNMLAYAPTITGKWT